MAYRARVTLAGDPKGMHARPAAQIGSAIRGLDAEIVFIQGDNTFRVRTRVPTNDLMRAAIALDLDAGAAFEVTCAGPQAETAFRALERAFTEGPLTGSRFEVLEPGTDVESGGPTP